MNAVKMIQKENQLELPLFFLDEEPKTAEVIPFEPKPEWTDDEVRQLRDGLLWHSLRVLADGRAGSEIKQETMAWVMSMRYIHSHLWSAAMKQVTIHLE
ncbi:cytochrome P450 [Escherichia coli]|nr:cytochrome P450 [Escherichia coli]